MALQAEAASGPAIRRAAPVVPDELHRTVRKAGRALARGGLVDAFGHCSARIDEAHFLVSAPKPLGTVRPGEPGIVVPIEGELPAGVLGEVRAHQHIYLRRPDVGGVCRFLSPKVMSLSALRRTPRARHVFGSFFAPQAPLWENPASIHSDALGAGVAATLGSARAVVMLGNGAISAGANLIEAVAFAWFLEDAARVELDVLHAGASDAFEFSPEQARARSVPTPRGYERLWDYLCDGDPE